MVTEKEKRMMIVGEFLKLKVIEVALGIIAIVLIIFVPYLVGTLTEHFTHMTIIPFPEVLTSTQIALVYWVQGWLTLIIAVVIVALLWLWIYHNWENAKSNVETQIFLDEKKYIVGKR